MYIALCYHPLARGWCHKAVLLGVWFKKKSGARGVVFGMASHGVWCSQQQQRQQRERRWQQLTPLRQPRIMG
jgi:hypothetical protein